VVAPVAPPALQPAGAWETEVRPEPVFISGPSNEDEKMNTGAKPDIAPAAAGGFFSLIKGSRSLPLLLTTAAGLLADWLDLLRSWLDWGWDLVLWTMGVLPELTSEVKTTLTSSEEAAKWFKIDWGAVLPKVALVVVVVVFFRLLANKRELDALKKQQEVKGAAEA
jgi:hypothetical protein